MAVDDALLGSCAAGATGFPFLRFYRWDPPALSLGYHQDAAQAADDSALQDLGLELVRRPTGGRAVLHEDELTYSVVAPCREGSLSGPVMQTYRRISEALVDAMIQKLRGLGLHRLQGTVAKDNKPAIFFFHAFGFRVVESTQANEGHYLLELDLAAEPAPAGS